jgi:hypothetical protein
MQKPEFTELYTCNARFGGKFEAVRVQSLHATNNFTKNKISWKHNLQVRKTVAFREWKIVSQVNKLS